MRNSHFLPLAVLAMLGSHAGIAAPTCKSLLGAELADTTIKAATDITAAQAWSTPPDALSRKTLEVPLPFCRVEGRIGREIEFEVWLPPADQWNGKYLGNGNGAYAGFINYGAMLHGLRRGYATGSTDTGHKGSPMDATWALNSPQRIEDYGYKAQHLVAVVAKQLVGLYYAQPPKHAYFMGCSNGGYQGLTEVQRFPQDYDGVVSGAPGTTFSDMSTSVLVNGRRNLPGTPGFLKQSDMDLVIRRMTESCDAVDGVKDDLIEYPPACKFSYESLQCAANQTADCLTAAQVDTVKALYAPLTDARGKEIYPPPAFGTVLPVSELERRGKLGADMYRYLVYHDANWDPAGFDLDRDLAAARKQLGGVLDSSNADLRPFANNGGKLILYHGWSDSGPSPFNSIAWLNEVGRKVGRAETDNFFRMFMVPGMYHCRGGPGPNSFGNAGDPPVIDAQHDVLMALEQWVEQGRAPERIVASRIEGTSVDMTRPLCAYPKQAHYKGTGDTRRAENFSCVER